MSTSRHRTERETARRTRSPQRVAPRARPPRRAGAAALELVRLLAGAVQEIGRAIVATGEALGRIELRAGRGVSKPLLGALRGGRAVIATLERVATPARAVGAAILGAAIALAVSQFVDYRGIGIGTPLYQGVESVAPPPQTEHETAGSAHSYALLPVAVLAIGALAFALRGRWQLGRAVSLLGLIAIAVTLAIDLPKGLDEGATARSFEGAEATLLEGFWVQLASSTVLAVCGILLGRYARGAERAGRRAAPAGRGRARRRGAAPAAGARA